MARSRLREVLPPQLFDFLNPLGTEWDAPIVGGKWQAAVRFRARKSSTFAGAWRAARR